MTTYQEFWNKEIENLLAELQTPESLRLNIVDTLNNSGRTGVYENQIINALRIGLAIKEGNLNTAFVASMQSGKSGTIYFLCNYVLPAIGFLGEREHIIFVTSMRDTDLFVQNVDNLEKDYYDVTLRKSLPSRIKVFKMDQFFKRPNPGKVVRDFRVKLIVRDEDQYGCGSDSSFDIAFHQFLRKELKEIHLLAVSATPYDILHAHFNGEAEVEVVEGVRTPTYYGITEMLRDGLIENLPLDFSTLQKNGDDFLIHPSIIGLIDHLNSFEDGLGIIRESNTGKAAILREKIKEIYNKDIEVLLIGSNGLCDYSIDEGLATVRSLVLSQGKRVVLIVVQALSAGKDLGMLKEKVRFGIETRDKQLANGAQGITGRFCGYHNNRSFKILAAVDLLEHYSAFEMDWEIFSDSDWNSTLLEADVRGLTTQTRFQVTQQAGTFIHIDEIVTIPFEQLCSDEGRRKLDFLEDSHYDKLTSFFEPENYENSTKGMRLGAKDVTIRLASSYGEQDNRVYKYWDADKSKDFGNVFFKKNTYEYGILISNYPLNHEKNQIGFCGIKIFKVGEIEEREEIVDVENSSMYSSVASL